METVFLLIRAPFVLIGAVLVTVIGVPLIIVFGTAIFLFWLIIAPLGWLLFILPFKFFEAAFQNRSEMLSAFVKESFSKWQNMIVDSVNDLFKSIASPYTTLYSWLISGSTD
jgi:hypothetical protein